MNAEAEGQMGPWPGAIDDETVGVLDRFAVAIAGDVPHHECRLTIFGCAYPPFPFASLVGHESMAREVTQVTLSLRRPQAHCQ